MRKKQTTNTSGSSIQDSTGEPVAGVPQPAVSDKWTVRENFHMSSASYAILLNGEHTGITRCRLTHGPPDYAVQLDVLIATNKEEFDLLEHTTAEVHEWCAAHLSQPQGSDAGPRAQQVPDEEGPKSNG